MARIDVPALTPLDRQCRQDAGAISACVDANTVRPLLDRGRDGVPVNHHKTMVGLVKKEGVTDPAQIRLKLLVELDTRPDAGVDEQEITEPAGIDEAFKELDVVLGDRSANRFELLGRLELAESAVVDAVAGEAFGPAKAGPVLDQLLVAAKNPKQDLLVIAEQEYRFDVAVTEGP